jgi:flagellar biosynthetic protein FliQ
MLEHLGKGLFYIILISMPIVLTAAGIGLVVGILQAVTQVQEQTIAAAPKILGVFLVILVGGGMIIKILHNYMVDAINLSMNVIPKEKELVLPPGGWESPERIRQKFFNPDKFVRKREKPTFEELISKPLDSPYLKEDKVKEPDVYTPPPPIPDASISEEIDNYKDMREAEKDLRVIPGMEQKTPVIPPLSTPGTNPSISVLPGLDEPPAIDPGDLNNNNSIASGSTDNTQYQTGAAAYLTPDGNHKFDYKVKGTTILINTQQDSTYYGNKASKSVNTRGSIILEAE